MAKIAKRMVANNLESLVDIMDTDRVIDRIGKAKILDSIGAEGILSNLSPEGLHQLKAKLVELENPRLKKAAK